MVLRPVILEDAKAIYAYTKGEETTHFVFPIYQSITDIKNHIANYFMLVSLIEYDIESKSIN